MAEALHCNFFEHDRFFSRIIAMIPSELYTHAVSEDNIDDLPNKYYQNRKLPLTTAEKKTISKAKKAEKYGKSENNQASQIVIAVEATISGASEQKTEQTGADLEELRNRLQVRILTMKGQRTSNKLENRKNSSDNVNGNLVLKKISKTKGNTEKGEQPAAKRVRRVGTAINGLDDHPHNSVGMDVVSAGDSNNVVGNTSFASSNVSIASQSSNAVENEDMQFSLVKQVTSLGADASNDSATKKPKGNKVQRLQRLLHEAEKKRARVKALTSAGDTEGLQRLEGEKWNDALKGAKGERTLIVGSSSIEGSEGKLKKALKKREKAKQKSAEEWSERLAAVEQTKTDRVNKRETNIQQRAMKKKGIEIPVTEATSATTGADVTAGGGPGSGRKRLFHHLKNTAAAAANEAGGASGGNGSGKDGNRNSGNHHKSSSSGGNRAGFEGKKKNGDYLNK